MSEQRGVALEVIGVTKRYGARVALADVSLSVAYGVVLGILGQNGSGKSVLLRLIATAERPTAGRIMVGGHDTVVAPRAARRMLGFVPDAFLPYPGLTVAEHLELFADLYGLSRREGDAAVEAMLQLVDLERWRGSSVANLSRGQSQRLALGTALLHDPMVLVMDEPLAGLDQDGYEEMLEVLAELRAMGKTILLAGNRVADLRQLCDQAAVLSEGRLVAIGAMEDVIGERRSEPAPMEETQTDLLREQSA